MNNSLSLSQVCLCSILYSCFFNHDPYIKANHKNTGTMYTSRPCLSHLLHFKPTNANNHIRFRIILQKPQNPICFGPYWPITWEYNNCIKQLLNIQGGADKSLARPGRKKATATKLGIYPTDSPQSPIHFLASCSNFCKPLKKKFRRLSVQPGLCGSNDLHVGLKMATFRLFFSPRNRW